MSSLLSVGFMLSLFTIPLIQGRTQKITMIIAACALQALMLSASGAAPTFLLFGISCVILGFSGGFVDTFTNSAVVDVHKADSARYLGYIHGLFGVGSLLAPFLFFWLLRHTEWRGVYFTVSGISAVTALSVYFLTARRGGERAMSATREQLFKMSDLLDYMRRKRNIALSLACFFSTVAQGGVLSWIVRYMTLRFDAAELGAMAFSAFWVCATINRFCLSQTIKQAPMKFFTIGAVLHGVFLTIGIVSANPIVLCVMVGAVGLSGGHFFPVLISEFAMGYEGKTSFTTSLMMFIAGLSRIFTPVLVAYTSTQISLFIGIMIPAVAAFVAAGCGWLAVKAAAYEAPVKRTGNS
jgi:fucose permease